MWGGGERCQLCGFVPIGAGLRGEPKRRRRKGRYREPGALTPWLTGALLIGTGIFGFQVRPWEDDWEFFRALVGQGRIHNIEGRWEAVRTLRTAKGEKGPIAKTGAKKFAAVFSKNGKVTLLFHSGSGELEATGRYTRDKLKVIITGLKGNSSNLPKALTLDLSWNGPKLAVATTGKMEKLFLRKRDKGNSWVAMMKGEVTDNALDATKDARGALVSEVGG